MAEGHVRIRTSAPYVPNDTIIPHELNFSYLVSTIQDEIADEPNNYEEQVQRCVFNALRFCERELFYFNESRDEQFVTRPNVAIYTKEDSRGISDSIRISGVFADTIHLTKRHVVESTGTDTGFPSYYDYYNKQLLLYPTPDKEYNIRLVLQPMRLAEIKDINEPHPWFTDGFDLLRCRARYEFYKNIVHDMDRAGLAYADYEEQLSALRAETHMRGGVYKLVPSRL